MFPSLFYLVSNKLWFYFKLTWSRGFTFTRIIGRLVPAEAANSAPQAAETGKKNVLHLHLELGVQ